MINRIAQSIKHETHKKMISRTTEATLTSLIEDRHQQLKRKSKIAQTNPLCKKARFRGKVNSLKGESRFLERTHSPSTSTRGSITYRNPMRLPPLEMIKKYRKQLKKVDNAFDNCFSYTFKHNVAQQKRRAVMMNYINKIKVKKFVPKKAKKSALDFSLRVVKKIDRSAAGSRSTEAKTSLGRCGLRVLSAKQRDLVMKFGGKQEESVNSLISGKFSQLGEILRVKSTRMSTTSRKNQYKSFSADKRKGKFLKAWNLLSEDFGSVGAKNNLSMDAGIRASSKR